MVDLTKKVEVNINGKWTECKVVATDLVSVTTSNGSVFIVEKGELRNSPSKLDTAIDMLEKELKDSAGLDINIRSFLTEMKKWKNL